ncbi:hypothetical protein TNCV_4338891 [Trichonephila clavipes]|nr:hypothetical protein TNCV_4338891 [Trichonephila clavipes]
MTLPTNCGGHAQSNGCGLGTITSDNGLIHKVLCRTQAYIALRDGNFAMREKDQNRLVPGPDYVVDALKFPNQAPRGYGKLQHKSMTWCCPDGKHLYLCWLILAVFGQSLALNGPVVDSRDLNLVFGNAKEALNN